MGGKTVAKIGLGNVSQTVRLLRFHGRNHTTQQVCHILRTI